MDSYGFLAKSIKNRERERERDQVALNGWSHFRRIEKLFADAAVQTFALIFCMLSLLNAEVCCAS